MKRYLMIMLLLFVIVSCKKSNDSSVNVSAPVDVQVSGLTSRTSISITVIDETMSNIKVMEIHDQFGNTTYHTSKVNPGDKVKITVTANLDDNLQGDGEGQFKFFFKGQQMGGHGGQINKAGFTVEESVPTI